jgi:hypothetical protein
LSMLLRCEKH